MALKPIKIVDESFNSFYFIFISFLHNMAQETFAKQRLIYSILKFLDKEIQNESANAERRESIEGKLNIH